MQDGSFGGHYFHHSAHLIEALHLSDQSICACDPIHKGGVVDSHKREDSSFLWFVEIQISYRENFF